MRIVTGVATAVLISGVLAVAPAAGPAYAGTLGISSIQDLVVDQAHGRVYVSGGALATADLTATPTGTVAGISAARQMTLTPNGSQLVVADGDGLTVVDTATATVLRTISTGTNSCPDAVAPAAGKVFFSYGDCTNGTPGLAAVDLDTDTVTKNIATGTVVLSADQAAVLKSVAATPNMLVLRAGPTLAIFDATGGSTPTVSLRVSKSFSPSLHGSVAVDPTGSEVVAGGDNWQAISAFSTTDLSTVRTYPASPGGAAFRSDGRLAIAETSAGDASLYSSSGTYLASLNFLPREENVKALGYGSERFFVATSVYTLGVPTFSLWLAPVGPPAAITITSDHSTYNYRSTVTLTIKLPSTHIRTVSVYRRTEGHDLLFFKTAEVSPTTRTLVVKVPGLIHNTSFQARFDGDDAFAPALASRAIKVRAKVVISSASTSVVNGYHRLHPNPSPTLTFTVYPYHPHQCLRIAAVVLVNGKWRALVGGGFDECVRTNSNSRLAVRLIHFKRGDKIKVWATYSNGGTSVEPPPGGAGNTDSLTVLYRIQMY